MRVIFTSGYVIPKQTVRVNPGRRSPVGIRATPARDQMTARLVFLAVGGPTL